MMSGGQRAAALQAGSGHGPDAGPGVGSGCGPAGLLQRSRLVQLARGRGTLRAGWGGLRGQGLGGWDGPADEPAACARRTQTTIYIKTH